MKSFAVPQVTTSQHIDAARLLLLVPKGGFLELRALLLERLDRHMEALRCHSAPVALPCAAFQECTWHPGTACAGTEPALTLECQIEALVCG